MAVLSTMKTVGVVLLLGSAGVSGQTFLAPEQDIILPASSSATEPLEWLGANSPYFAGPNINGISNAVPQGCTVEQVAYNVRHGSRYPDSGAYTQWTTLYAKIQAADFTSTGSLAFLKSWQPVLTNPALQIAQESPTGYKEAYDLGYQLRTRYPKLYTYGTPFISWANLYPRVVQTAQNFVRGFLGSTASTLGQIITVNSTGSGQALFDSLSPSDLCPAFVDGNGGTQQVEWNSLYLPPILARLEAMIHGNLTFTTTDVSIMPYLCGFESQITGTLSPWCSVFTDAELKQYEYSQDLRYYYGTGPGVDLASKMMLPYLNSLVGILAHGPGLNGTYANGTSYTLPKIITAFMNDGQITELGAVTGVWDDTISLGNGMSIPNNYKYIASHFVSMRGTVAFERLNCVVKGEGKGKRDVEVTETVRKTVTVSSCPPTSTSGFVTTASSASASETGSGPGSGSASKSGSASGSGSATVKNSSSYTSVSSKASGTRSASASASHSGKTTTTTSHTTLSTPTSSSPITTPTSSSKNQTYIRILLNDAVYPVPSCQSGPGRSCLMSDYVSLIAKKVAAAGDLVTRCNVTAANAPTRVKGASFFTDLADSWVASVVP